MPDFMFEYEAMAEKIKDPHWKPDFGPTELNVKAGVTAVSARDFLVAFNVNLNTTSTRRANAIAFDIRERGRTKREGNPVTGKIVKDENGKPVMIPGSLKAVKAIGWFIEEYGVAKFNKKCRDSVFEYLQDWNEMTRRIGFWVDLFPPDCRFDLARDIFPKIHDFRDMPNVIKFTSVSSDMLRQTDEKISNPKFRFLDLLVYNTDSIISLFPFIYS